MDASETSPRRARADAVAKLAGVLLVAAIALIGVVVLRRAAPHDSGEQRLTHGSVIVVRDTPHFWVADERGVLHWASGTRALVGRYVRWDTGREVTPAELETLPRGEPWLLTPIGLVRGTADGELYVVVWHSGVAWPALLRAPSADALRPFGITPALVEQHATDRRTWERLHGVDLEALAVELTPVDVATSAANGQPHRPAWWTEGAWSGIGAQASPEQTYPVSVRLVTPFVDPQAGMVIGEVTYPSFPCSGTLALLAGPAAGGEDEVVVAERLTDGLQHCTDQGRVTLARRTDRRLFYTWSLPDQRMAVTAFLLRDDAAVTPAAGATPSPMARR
jgi:hypothetical protein